MIKIIKERTPVTVKEYYLNFWYKDDPDAGFCFPATRQEEPDFSCMGPEMKANYFACLKDERLSEAEFEVCEYTHMEPAVGLCICGREVVLEGSFEGATRCECGRWYNVFGQSLLDPKYWYERDGEDDYYSDMPDDNY